MEENKIMNEEDVLETTEEIVKTTSNGCFKKVATIGLAMIVGGLAYKYVVEPGVGKVKTWRANRKAAKQEVVNDTSFDDEYENYSEYSEE
jgi:hypothetical protein